MLQLPSLLILVSCTWTRYVLASPILTLPASNLPSPTPEADCYNLTAAFNSTCWDTLDIADYLTNPQTGWVSHVPTCDDSTSSGINKQGCCDFANGEPWSTCYIRIGRGLPGTDCSVINPTSCDWDEEQRMYFAIDGNSWNVLTQIVVNQTLSPWEQARARYVIWTLVNVNTFFNTYYTGMCSQFTFPYRSG